MTNEQRTLFLTVLEAGKVKLDSALKNLNKEDINALEMFNNVIANYNTLRENLLKEDYILTVDDWNIILASMQEVRTNISKMAIRQLAVLDQYDHSLIPSVQYLANQPDAAEREKFLQGVKIDEK